MLHVVFQNQKTHWLNRNLHLQLLLMQIQAQLVLIFLLIKAIFLPSETNISFWGLWNTILNLYL